MVALKLCIASLAVICFGVSCQALDQPEARFNNGKVPSVSTSPRRKSWSLGQVKRGRPKSTNVHIENIYIPQNIQNGDNFGPDNAAYPVYTFSKPPTEYYTVDEITEATTDPSKVEVQPSLMAQQAHHTLVKPEQINEFLTAIPNPTTFSQNTQTAQLVASENGKYYLIVNVGNSIGSQSPVVLQPSIIEDNENKDSEMEVSQSEVPIKPVQPKPKLPQLQSTTIPYKTTKKSDVNQVLSIAQYLLGHPLISANELETLKLQERKNRTKSHEKEEKDQMEDNGDSEVVEIDDDIAKNAQVASELTTKDVKLPLEFILGLNHPSKKVDDRVALVYLRRTKKGRKMWQEY